MDENKQNQTSGQVQFDSNKIAEMQGRQQVETQAQFRTRLTLKDKLKKWGEKLSMKGPRKFIMLGAGLVAIAGITVGTVLLMNMPGDKSSENGGNVVENGEEFSEKWFGDLDVEIADALNMREVIGVVEKIDASIIKVREAGDDKVLLERLYEEKTRTLSANMEYEEALLAYEEMLMDVGESVNLYRNIAQVYINVGDYAGALGSYKKALALMPTDHEDYGYIQNIITELEQTCS